MHIMFLLLFACVCQSQVLGDIGTVVMVLLSVVCMPALTAWTLKLYLDILAISKNKETEKNANQPIPVFFPCHWPSSHAIHK